MDDLISRQEAIEVADVVWCVTGDVNVAKVWDQLKNLPSAHSEIEERKEESAQNVPKEDLISRKAAIEALGERPMVWTDDDQYALGERNQYDMNRLAIETLPSAQPEPQWIPVGERLPDMWDERYLVSLAWGGIGVMEYKSTGFHNYGSFAPVPIESITAWMPLPEPYREERRTDE